MIAFLLLAAAAPIDRSFVLVETERPTAEITQCVETEFDRWGAADISTTYYGQRVDFRFQNMGGAVKDPTMALEVHDGAKRTLIFYGFGAFKGAVKNRWKALAKPCFPELRDTKVTKPGAN